jgi:hypothetical protein
MPGYETHVRFREFQSVRDEFHRQGTIHVRQTLRFANGRLATHLDCQDGYPALKIELRHANKKSKVPRESDSMSGSAPINFPVVLVWAASMKMRSITNPTRMAWR